MSELLLAALLWFAAIGCGLIAGVFFAFSAFIMTALGGIPPAQGAAAMNAINRTILRSSFMPLFLGTTLAALVLAAAVPLRWGERDSLVLLAAGIVYVVGMFGCTMARNVPLNNALLAAAPASASAAAVWVRYLRDWTLWNHVRTLASIAACALYIAAIAAM